MQRLARYSSHLSFPRILDPVVLSLTRFLIVFVLEAVLLSRILENPCSPERPCLILPHHHLELRRPWNKIPCFLRMRLHCSPEKIVQGSKSSSFVAAEDGLVEVSGIVCWYASTWWAPMIQPWSSFVYEIVDAGIEWSPRMDVTESGPKYVVTVELPGVRATDVQVEVDDDRC